MASDSLSLHGSPPEFLLHGPPAVCVDLQRCSADVLLGALALRFAQSRVTQMRKHRVDQLAIGDEAGRWPKGGPANTPASSFVSATPANRIRAFVARLRSVRSQNPMFSIRVGALVRLPLVLPSPRQDSRAASRHHSVRTTGVPGKNHKRHPLIRRDPRKFDRKKRAVRKPLSMNWQRTRVPDQRPPADTRDSAHDVLFLNIQRF